MENFKPITRKHTLATDPVMPFGKYKGKCLDAVPASYLLWLWDDKQLSNTQYPELYNYIKSNKKHLEQTVIDDNEDLDALVAGPEWWKDD